MTVMTSADRDDAVGFLRFMRLTDAAEIRDGEVSFRLGILWPYTADLRRVRAAYDDSAGVASAPLLAAIATLHERIAFAPGHTGRDVGLVHTDVRAALAARGR